MTQPGSLRWLAISIFILSSSLSFLDRQVLAALAPELRREFALSNEQYGYILSVFSMTYALSAPAMGLFIDRVGLNLGISVSVALWSVVGMATGLVNGFGGLLACRGALGAAESGGIPASGKASALYLLPGERAMGAAFGQIGISIGLVGAPLFAGWLSHLYGWRSAFIATGALGFVWVPLWLATARRVPTLEAPSSAPKTEVSAMLRDRRLWALVAANVLAMAVYSLWMNWTTMFLVSAHGLTQGEANQRLAWIPPIFAALGGLTGGWLSLRWARGGDDLPRVRIRVCLLSGLLLLMTGLVPSVPGAGWATAAICWSFFWSVCFSVNLYALPLDLFGAGRAAFGVSALTFAYGAMQTLISPLIGRLIDSYGFQPVCALVAALPLAAVAVLRLAVRSS